MVPDINDLKSIYEFNVINTNQNLQQHHVNFIIRLIMVLKVILLLKSGWLTQYLRAPSTTFKSSSHWVSIWNKLFWTATSPVYSVIINRFWLYVKSLALFRNLTSIQAIASIWIFNMYKWLTVHFSGLVPIVKKSFNLVF